MSIFNLDTNLVLWNIKAAQKFEDPAKKTIQMGLQSSCFHKPWAAARPTA